MKRKKKIGYKVFNQGDWRKGIKSYNINGLELEYHFVKNIKDGTLMGEKIFKVVNNSREYLKILP